MIIVGAQGLAKELFVILTDEMNIPDKEILFFDNVNEEPDAQIAQKCTILRNFNQVQKYIKEGNVEYTLGLGNPKHRILLREQFQKLGGNLKSIISEQSSIGNFFNEIGEGCQIMQGVRITANVKIGKGVLINLNSTISHDTTIADNVEIACGVNIAGRCNIGENTFIGTNSSILPGITIGKNVIIGAGSVVINHIPDNVTVVGNPSRIIKHHG